MPFTIAGDWTPMSSTHHKPIKVIKEKRRSSYVTIILNLSLNSNQLKDLCSTLKQRLGCGGSVKEGHIELQGNQVEFVKIYLKEHQIK